MRYDTIFNIILYSYVYMRNCIQFIWIKFILMLPDRMFPMYRVLHIPVTSDSTSSDSSDSSDSESNGRVTTDIHIDSAIITNHDMSRECITNKIVMFIDSNGKVPIELLKRFYPSIKSIMIVVHCIQRRDIDLINIDIEMRRDICNGRKCMFGMIRLV